MYTYIILYSGFRSRTFEIDKYNIMLIRCLRRDMLTCNDYREIN